MAAKIPAAGVDLDGAITINESSADADFRIETNGNANMFVVDGGNDAVIFNGSTSNFASGSQVVQIYNSGLSFTSGYGIQGGANTDRASVNLTSGASGHIVFKANNSEVARFTTDGLAIGGTGAANTLDDYEEGTWTPTMVGQTTAGSLGYSYQNGRYVKVGQMVTAYCYVECNSVTSTPAGNLRIYGFPFAVYNASATYPAVTIGYSVGFPSTNSATTGHGVPNATYIQVLTLASGDGRDNISTSTNAGNINGNEGIVLSMTYKSN